MDVSCEGPEEKEERHVKINKEEPQYEDTHEDDRPEKKLMMYGPKDVRAHGVTMNELEKEVAEGIANKHSSHMVEELWIGTVLCPLEGASNQGILVKSGGKAMEEASKKKENEVFTCQGGWHWNGELKEVLEMKSTLESEE